METKEILFLHYCCNSGYKSMLKFVREYEEKNVDIKLKVISYSYLQSYDLKIYEKYKYDNEILKKISYIVLDGNLIELEN